MDHTNDTTGKKIHQGRNVKRFREMLGLKQEAFAAELGEEWTQRRVSLLEGKEEIEQDLLEQVAVNIISNTFHDFKDNAVANANHCTFNPLDKVIELYERMLKDKNEMIEKLERIITDRK